MTEKERVRFWPKSVRFSKEDSAINRLSKGIEVANKTALFLTIAKPGVKRFATQLRN